MRHGECRDHLQQIDEPLHKQQRQQESDMIVTEEYMLDAQLQILGQLLSERRAIAGIVKIVRLEPGENDLFLVTFPNERAEDGVGASELLEEIECDRHIFG